MHEPVCIELPITMRRFSAMGTRFECVLGGFERPTLEPERAAIAEELELLVRDWHDRLTAYDPASCVSVINRLAGERPVSVDPELLGLLTRCVDHARNTEGAFDITLGTATMTLRNPSRSKTGGARCCAALRLDPQTSTVRFLEPSVRLDFGAVAKGFVLDLAGEELRGLGVRSALIHGGTSSVVAIGNAPDGHPWRVRAVPDDPDAPCFELSDECLSVSSSRTNGADAREHIFDARAGRASSGAEWACVTGPSGEVCEVWSTALIVDPGLVESVPPGYTAGVRSRGQWNSAFEPPAPRWARDRETMHERV